MDQPHWVDDDLMEKLSELHLFKVSFLVGTRELKRIRGGPLIGEMIKNMKKIIHNNADEHKIYMFSAHDSTILSFLSALDVYEPHAPPYCSMVMVELHEKNGIDFILYRNDTSRDPYELSLKGCTNQCLFEKFIKLTAAVIPEDIKAECVVHHESYNVALPSVIAGSIIGCGVLILLIAGYAFHKRKTAIWSQRHRIYRTDGSPQFPVQKCAVHYGIPPGGMRGEKQTAYSKQFKRSDFDMKISKGESCSAYKCSNNRGKNPNLSFFRFPRDPERCNIKQTTPDAICHTHTEEEIT
uniref:acid phosphatase n=1 Tax=Strigamia maritima TaxID=126957 RepID=T1IKA1_STRMM